MTTSPELSELHVIQVVEAALSSALPGGVLPHDQSFTAAGGTSVDALMVVDDILMRLGLGDGLAANVLSALMLVRSLDDFPREVIKIASRAAARPE